MTDQAAEAGSDAALAAGRRAAGGGAARAGAEIVGKASALVLFAVIARSLGERDLGVLLLAFAYLGIVVVPIGLGTDLLLVREVAKHREQRRDLYWDVLGLKLVLAPIVLGAGILLLRPLGYDALTREVVAVLAICLGFEILAKSPHSVFVGMERNGLLAITVVVQRLFTAATAVTLLATGAGIVTVAWVFAAGGVLHFALALLLLPRAMDLGRPRLRPRSWWALSRRSAPFAVQEVLTVLLFKLDAVLLSLLASAAAVGRYGSAYRLVEATMFLGYGLTGAFLAMFTYLGPDTEPSLGGVFARALKLALLLLVPIGVAFTTLPGPIVELVYGEGLAAAAASLRLLGPIVVMLAFVVLCSSLIVSRTSPKRVFPLTACAVVVNVVLNFVLVPRFGEEGAAMAMLATEVLLVALTLREARRQTGPLPWRTVLAAPATGGGAMAAALLTLQGLPVLLALLAGGAVYAAVAYAVERAVSPDDLAFALRVLRRRSAA